MDAVPLPEWASEPCIMGIDEAGRGPVLGPMVYGCLYCPLSYQQTLASLNFADSKTLKEEKREELFENLKSDPSLGWGVDVIDPRDLSAKMLQREKINLNEISHNSAMGLVRRVLDLGVFLTEVYVDTVGDADKYREKLSARFPGVKFVVSKKADSLYPVVSGASIVAKVTRDRSLRDWVLDETAQNITRNFGSGYPGVYLCKMVQGSQKAVLGNKRLVNTEKSVQYVTLITWNDKTDPDTKAWLEKNKHPLFGFPTLVRFSWGTCTPYFKDCTQVLWECDKDEEEGSTASNGKKQLKLSSVGFTGYKRKIEDIESSGKGRCKFFQTRKLELVTKFG
ncbi:Ribonuclease [Rhynchospora pubera]|uniref:Ribonuclease n=1 Tax=Rhynchospora pubera TaxID=906938 RepID=A0AAV8FVZ1_9POAL|nr:Ribonuclease [Rhynchospora pubera]KAJ4819447.1 Ribonuclease [Rhynchospora pubera]